MSFITTRHSPVPTDSDMNDLMCDLYQHDSSMIDETIHSKSLSITAPMVSNVGDDSTIDNFNFDTDTPCGQMVSPDIATTASITISNILQDSQMGNSSETAPISSETGDYNLSENSVAIHWDSSSIAADGVKNEEPSGANGQNGLYNTSSNKIR
jgi:hypothetical protein